MNEQKSLSFVVSLEAFSGELLARFPHFLWSPDGRFLARCTDQAIFVYDSQDDFELTADPATEKRGPIKFADGLQGFDWSPRENIISAWIPEKNNVPARLQLIRIPSRQEVRSWAVRDQITLNVAKLQTARSRLHRPIFFRPNIHFAAFFKIFNI